MNEHTITGIKEAAKLTGMSQRTILRKIAAGDFPEPIIEYDAGHCHTYRVWRKSDLEGFQRPGRSWELMPAKKSFKKIAKKT